MLSLVAYLIIHIMLFDINVFLVKFACRNST